jgi:pimeloyl-ACP methyl ester carboxylesterase
MDAPTLLLLHGLPSSSRMFEPLLARLSGSYQLIAPDYLSFGHSEWPDPKALRVHHRSLRRDQQRFTEAPGFARYALYMQDYGGQVSAQVFSGVRRPSLVAMVTRPARETTNAISSRSRGVSNV